MQRTLFLVRHARAFESSPGQKDADRELRQVGRTSAIHMGKYLYSLYPNPQRILCSSALRAIDTAQILAEQMHFATEQVEVTHDLYEASVRSLLALVKELETKHYSVMLVAHNPAISYFAEYLTSAEVGNLAPGGVVLLHLDGMEWAEGGEGNYNVVKYHEPKE